MFNVHGTVQRPSAFAPTTLGAYNSAFHGVQPSHGQYTANSNNYHQQSIGSANNSPVNESDSLLQHAQLYNAVSTGHSPSLLGVPNSNERQRHQHLQQQQVASQMIYQYSQSAPASPASDFATTTNVSQTTSGSQFSPGLCAICNDRATGKHYGASSCDGCKGFFRRTVRKRQRYECRFSRSCLIDRDRRNACRFCRYKKCVTAGMRKEAVQSERDRINSRKQLKSEGSSYVQQIAEMLKAEEVYSQLRNSVITPNVPATAETGVVRQVSDLDQSGYHLANIDEISDAMKQQLLLLVDWAKTFPDFYNLPLDDQVSLLRAYAAEHLLFGVTKRSLQMNDILLLSNETYIYRQHVAQLADINHIVSRILDELIEPMRLLDLDDTEYCCLKSIVFFNPNAHGLSDRVKAKQKQQTILLALENHVDSKPMQTACRFGQLLLLLPSLQSIGQQMKESLQLASLFGIARTDSLLQELLGSSDGTEYAPDEPNARANTNGSQQTLPMVDSCSNLSQASNDSSGNNFTASTVLAVSPASRISDTIATVSASNYATNSKAANPVAAFNGSIGKTEKQLYSVNASNSQRRNSDYS